MVYIVVNGKVVAVPKDEIARGEVFYATEEEAEATIQGDPDPQEGDTKEENGVTYIFTGGKWVEQEPAATGGEEVADREKRESVERSRRLGNILSSEEATSKKKS